MRQGRGVGRGAPDSVFVGRDGRVQVGRVACPRVTVAQPVTQVVEDRCPVGRVGRSATDSILIGGDDRVEVGRVARPHVAVAQPVAQVVEV